PPERANGTNIRIGVDLKGPVRAIQQATMNLFADMNAQPATRQADLVRATPAADRTAPVSRVDAGAARPGGDGILEITGVASDAGGVVGGVEVSVDGGRSWHPADGTARWRYRWEAAAAPAANAILSRAVDDSGNLERGPGSRD